MIIPIEHDRLLILNDIAIEAMNFRDLWRVGRADKEVAAFLQLTRALDRLIAIGWLPDAEAPIDPPAIVSGAGDAKP